jgi:hypothetical protein
MIWTLLPFGLVAVLVAAIFLAASALAAEPGRSLEEKPRGEDTRANFLAGSKRFPPGDKHDALRT